MRPDFSCIRSFAWVCYASGVNQFITGMLVGCLATVCVLSVVWNVWLATAWNRWIDRVVTLANIKREQNAELDREKVRRDAIREIAGIRANISD
jgi:hypothetical protein